MKPSLIIYNVPNGKTRFAERITKFYGLKYVSGNLATDTIAIFTNDFLYLSQGEKPKGAFGKHAKSFREVADEINAAIPLTDWQSGLPPMTGEYFASAFRLERTKRWWNGKSWSMNYDDVSSEAAKQRNRKLQATRGDKNAGIEWRGLSEEPINTEE